MPKPFIFVIMPFHKSFDDIYALGIKQTCESLNTYCERLDEQIFEENMLDRIYNQISKADIIIADLTGKNPNVFYETGYAHALNKKVILLTKSTDDIPFDLKHHHHIIYNDSILTLKQELKKRIEWFVSNPKELSLPNENDLELYIQGEKLIAGGKYNINYTIFDSYYPYDKNSPIRIKLDIHNNSNDTYSFPFTIGLLLKNYYGTRNNEIVKTIKVNESDYLHLTPTFQTIGPYFWNSIEIVLIAAKDLEIKKKPIKVTIRVFTEFGITDIPISLKYNLVEYEGPIDF